MIHLFEADGRHASCASGVPRLSACKMLRCMQVVLRHVALAAADPLRAVALPNVAAAAARAAAARSSEAALLQARAALPCAAP